ncbi:zinc metalloprotease [Spirochaetia bacterium]|nr:zinc metalloprotease [Spirochaetia bacterium]
MPVSQTITHRGIPVEVSRRAVRVLRITVYPDCRVVVVAPRYAQPKEIYAFLEAKFSWIEKHLTKYREKARQKPLAENCFVNGEVYYVWGAPYRLEVIERRGHPRIEMDAGDPLLIMYVRPGSTKVQKQALLDKWRKQLVADAAPALITRWQGPLAAAAKKPDLGVEKVYLQKMKTHWGSCNSGQRTIRLNTELAAKPPEYLDYVVLHEMVHLIVPSHNQHFYRYMNKLMPQWKEIRKQMNKT